MCLPCVPEKRESLPFIPVKKPNASPGSIGEVPSTVGDAAAERMDGEPSDKEVAKTSADHGTENAAAERMDEEPSDKEAAKTSADRGTETSKAEKHATFVEPEAGRNNEDKRPSPGRSSRLASEQTDGAEQGGPPAKVAKSSRSGPANALTYKGR